MRWNVDPHNNVITQYENFNKKLIDTAKKKKKHRPFKERKLDTSKTNTIHQ